MIVDPLDDSYYRGRAIRGSGAPDFTFKCDGAFYFHQGRVVGGGATGDLKMDMSRLGGMVGFVRSGIFPGNDPGWIPDADIALSWSRVGSSGEMIFFGFVGGDGSAAYMGATSTLAAAITTAPPSGTLQTITLVDNDAVRNGQQFQVDNEIMAVASCLGDSKPQVLRGQAGTTPATHSSGATVYILGVAPTIKINGIPRGQLIRPWASGNMSGSSHIGHKCLGYSMPPGVRVAPGDVVTVTAPDWWTVSFGGPGVFSFPKGMADYVPYNGAGRSSHGTESLAKTMKVGMNTGGEYGPTTLAAPWVKNWLRGGTWDKDPVFSDYGQPVALVGTYALARIQRATGPFNKIDATMYPGLTGLFTVGWDDTISRDWTVTIESNDGTGDPTSTIVERVDLRNSGVGGVGKVVVADVKHYGGPITLTAPLAASAPGTIETIQVNSTADIRASALLQFDGEVMAVQTAPTDSIHVQVKRGGPMYRWINKGYNDSQPSYTPVTTHAAGTVGKYFGLSRVPSVVVRFSNPTPGKVWDLANVVVYGPGDFAYTDGVPVVLDKSDPWATNALFKDRLKGSSVLRWVTYDSSNGSNVSEPEDFMPPSAWSWGGLSFKVATANSVTPIVLARPVTPDMFVYTPWAGEDYAATLGAAIVTSPTPGTIETITVADAATAPVFGGQIFRIDSEWFRCLSAAGTDVVVERGASDGVNPTTPTTTHPANSPITVRGRVRIGDLQNFHSVNGWCVAEFETSVPHGMRNGIPPKYVQVNDDWNTTYRIATTLTQSLPAANLTTTLVGSLAQVAPGTSQTITVQNATGIAIGCWLHINTTAAITNGGAVYWGPEYVEVTNVVGNNVTITRGRGNTWGPPRAGAHSNGDIITICPVVTVASTAGMVPNLEFRAGTEDMLILSVVSPASLVLHRNGTPVAHTVGQSATSHVGGLITASGSPEYGAVANFGSPCIWVTGAKTFINHMSLPRWTGYTGPGNVIMTINGTQTIDGTKLYIKPYAPQSTFSFPFTPYEVIAHATGQVPGMDCWVNVSSSMSPGGMVAMTRALIGNLPPGRKLIIEYINEEWNSGFQELVWTTSMSKMLNPPGGLSHEWYVRQSGRLSDLARATAAEFGRQGDIVCLMGGQNGDQTSFDMANSLGVRIDAFANAPYLVPSADTINGPTSTIAAYKNTTPGQAADLFTYDTLYAGFNFLQIFFNSARHVASENARLGTDCKFYSYEGGVQESFPQASAADWRDWHTRERDATYHPSWYWFEMDLLAAMQTNSVDTFTPFLIGSLPADIEFQSMWAVYWGAGQDYGRGDGSDGKFDNRLISATDGLPTTKLDCESLEARTVSTRGGAYRDWNDQRVNG